MFNLKARPTAWTPKYLTHCKLCRLPLFSGDSYAWITKPMGMSHTACIEKAKKETES